MARLRALAIVAACFALGCAYAPAIAPPRAPTARAQPAQPTPSPRTPTADHAPHTGTTAPAASTLELAPTEEPRIEARAAVGITQGPPSPACGKALAVDDGSALAQGRILHACDADADAGTRAAAYERLHALGEILEGPVLDDDGRVALTWDPTDAPVLAPTCAGVRDTCTTLVQACLGARAGPDVLQTCVPLPWREHGFRKLDGTDIDDVIARVVWADAARGRVGVVFLRLPLQTAFDPRLVLLSGRPGDGGLVVAEVRLR